MTKPKCVHHWVLQDHDSNGVPGWCRKCGENKQFSGVISYGQDTMRRLNTARATEQKRMKFGIHLPNSMSPRENEAVW